MTNDVMLIKRQISEAISTYKSNATYRNKSEGGAAKAVDLSPTAISLRPAPVD